MIRNNIKIAWRSLWKAKGFSAINIMGLSMGMAAVLLIGLWVQHQLLYDNFYPEKEHIYKLMNQTEKDGEFNTHGVTMGPASKVLKEEYPEVKYAARVNWATEELLQYGDKHIKSVGNEVDPDFLTIFNFEVRSGTSGKLLDNPNTIILTESLAKNLFAEVDPLGKTVILGVDKPYKVTGVIRDLPSYTDFDFRYLIPLTSPAEEEGWRNMRYSTFITLQEGTDVERFNEKIKPVVHRHDPVLKYTSVFLYPMSRTHLYSQFKNGIPAGGQIEQVRLVVGIGLLILLIACVNFINLSTARSQKRAKEVGVRKVIGARKSNLIGQFLTESLLISIIAGVLAVIMAFLVLPVFNKILDHPLEFDWTNPLIWIGLLIFILFTGLLAGSYPAFVLSTFQPVKTIKGMAKQRKNTFGLREVLVIFQFGIAVVLIVATLVVHSQIKFAGEREIGYTTSRLLEIPIEGAMAKNYDALKNELLASGAIQAVTRTGSSVTEDVQSTGGTVSWPGASEEQVEDFGFILRRAESDFIKTVGLRLVEGRDLNYARLPGDSTSVLLNETAIREMGLEDPVGKIIKWEDKPYTVVGVFKDYISGSPFNKVHPMLVYASKNWMQNMVIRTDENQSIQRSLQKIEAIVKEFNPAYPFSYSFVDREYAKKFEDQKQTASLALIFSVLAIAISCLGLFGLASYIAETRTKEIGVRKVLGASVLGISSMLSKDFLKLVLLAILIATPMAWWAMSKWLDNFAYRIDLKWSVFALAGGVAILIALFTVSTQAVRAATANPVEALRDE